MRELVPCIIDLSPLKSATAGSDVWQHVAGQFDVAMREHGVVYLAGTGVSSALQDTFRTRAISFFKSSVNSKQRFSFAEKYGAEGYSSVGKETIANTLGGAGATRDVVESLVLHSAESSACPEPLRDPITSYIAHMDRLLATLMQLMDLALEVPAPGLSAAFRQPRNALRIAYYPVNGGGVEGEGYGAHTDFSGFTLLAQDTDDAFPAQGALQVLIGNEWLLAPPVKDTFVVNAGDLIERWTNGKYKSPVHRVVLAPNRTVPRLSIVYFTAPAHEVLVEPLTECCSEEEPPRYEAVYAGEWLKEKLQRTTT